VPYVSRERIIRADVREMVIDDGGVELVLRKDTK